MRAMVAVAAIAVLAWTTAQGAGAARVAPAARTAPARRATTAARADSIAPKAEIIGHWTGSSICVRFPGNEACNDESTIYDFVDLPKTPNAVHLSAYKIVNGEPALMSEMDFRYDPSRKRWACEFQTRMRAVWTFATHDSAMTGKLFRLPDSTVARNVVAKRS